ncbi:MAG TPA: MoxR family ATPase [Methylomirabilota bacterium]|jgi:MoxR-like ATPase|nr:MoxR family ATPase [Methylomirabilota bacterium]
MDAERVRELWQQLDRESARVVIGQGETLRMLMVALLADGHVLLEGVPGTGKTLLVRTFATCLGLEGKRIQFTPDLLPGDIIGTNLFDFQTNRFTLTRGPVFTEVLLADEVNRTPPKTQAALLEAMQERSVTVDGTTHPLARDFFVLATQNPIEHEGTYPLPEAQLDRFVFKLVMGYPARDSEVEMVRVHGHRTAMPRIEDFHLPQVLSRELLGEVRDYVASLRVADDVLQYIVDLVRATRHDPSLRVGGSPRACNVLASAARAWAVLEGRDFVIPDDVKALLLPVLRHRVILSPTVEVEGRTADEVLTQIGAQVAPPR